MRFQRLVVYVFAILAACDSRPDLLPMPVDRRGIADHGFATTGNERLPLGQAVMDDDLLQVHALLKAGSDPNARWGSHGDYFPLQEATETDRYGSNLRNRSEFIRLLLQHGADPNARWCPFETRGDYGGISCRSLRGVTPLIMAAIRDRADSTYFLLDAGADPMLEDWSGATALDYALSAPVFFLLQAAMFPDSSSRSTATLDFLEKRGASPRGMGPWDETPLARVAAGLTGAHILTPPPPAPGRELASASYTSERLWLILRLGADPNQRLTWGNVDWTPLAIAVLQDDPAAVRTLIEHGADPNARWCVTVDTDASRRTRAADCNLTNGITPLMYAASLGYFPIEKFLVEHGGNLSLRDWEGRTAADYRTKVRRPRTSTITLY